MICLCVSICFSMSFSEDTKTRLFVKTTGKYNDMRVPTAWLSNLLVFCMLDCKPPQEAVCLESAQFKRLYLLRVYLFLIYNTLNTHAYDHLRKLTIDQLNAIYETASFYAVVPLLELCEKAFAAYYTDTKQRASFLSDQSFFEAIMNIDDSLSKAIVKKIDLRQAIALI